MTPSEAFVKELRRRRYSERTVETYVGCLERFLNWCKKDVKEVTKKDIREWIEFHSNKGNAGNTMNVNLMALKFYFEEIQGRKMWVDIKYSKTPKKLPAVLSPEEVRKLLDSIKNPKHKFMISFMYGSGLRVSELLNIKVKDLVLDKGYGYVRNGKGGKDRLMIIPDRLREQLKGIIKLLELSDEDLIFTSERGKKYSVRTIQVIVRKAAKLAQLENWKEIHSHTLRHSFSTHLISHGNSVSEIQSLLGHKSPETTMIYVHLASPNLINIKSPLDC